ncbi:hypothetical protein COK71_09805 [Bacillus cereus]|nr:hypothetical protein COK71_09805 [Bacillus cereus]
MYKTYLEEKLKVNHEYMKSYCIFSSYHNKETVLNKSFQVLTLHYMHMIFCRTIQLICKKVE